MEMNILRWIGESALNKMAAEIVALLVAQPHVRLWNRGTLHSAPANGCPKSSTQPQSSRRVMEVTTYVTIKCGSSPNSIYLLEHLYLIYLLYYVACIGTLLSFFSNEISMIELEVPMWTLSGCCALECHSYVISLPLRKDTRHMATWNKPATRLLHTC